MKTLIPLAFAFALAAPAFAQDPPAPAPNPIETAAPDTPIDQLIEHATTPEDRARLMLRCAGPPPRPDRVAEKMTPKPETPAG